MEHIILMGFMGCGKSTVGYRLSYRLKKCLIDTDGLIEHREKQSISAMFAEKGENYFRIKETACLKSLFDELGDRIIALGGGTPMREANRPIIKKLGKVIYLKASPETIYGRLKHDKKRPLLQCENPKERICTLLEERDPVYESLADIVIHVDGKQMNQVVQELVDILKPEQKEKQKPFGENSDSKSTKAE